MKDQGFSRSEHDMCVYTKEVSQGDHLYLLLYVDDMLIAEKKMTDIKILKDLGAARRILGMDIMRDRKNGSLRLSQSVYLKKVVDNFRMSEAKSTQTPIGVHFKLG